MGANNLKYQTFWKRYWAISIDSSVVSILLIFIIVLLRQYPLVSLIFCVIVFFLYRILFHQFTGQTLGKRVTNIIVLDIDEKQMLSKTQCIKREIIPIVITLIVAYLIYENSLQQKQEYDNLSYIVDSEYSADRIFSNILSRSELQQKNFFDTTKYGGLALAAIVYLSMLSNTKRRGLHDMIAKSVVVRKEIWERENEDKHLIEKEDHGSHSS